MTWEGSILAREERLELGQGLQLRLLSALEVLQARREAAQLAGEDRERALCSNAALLARALERDGEPVYPSGEQVLQALRVEEISDLAQRWAGFNRQADLGMAVSPEQVQTLKKNCVRTKGNG